jgi:hypothetical protein
MNKLPFSMTGEALTIYVGGMPNTVRAGTVQYNQLREAILKDDWTSIPGLLAPGGALAKYLGDRFTVDGDKIAYDGVELPVELTRRIAATANEGTDPSPLLRFYERLHKNPSFRSRTQLFTFLQHLDIAIEPSGTFLAYKGINEDYTDKHTGKVPNNPGQVHEMARNLISDDADEGCHFGYHVGALSYAGGFGEVVVICRVDPEHVVCVPNDSSYQKMRVCRYEVIGEHSGETMRPVADNADLPTEYEYEDEDEVDDQDEDYEEAQSYHGDTDDDAPAFEMPQQEIKITLVPAPELDKLDTKGLMKRSIEELRKYASGRLKIHGASKIAGGKSTLVSKIMRVRRRLAK